MQRNEAISYLKDILRLNESISLDAITLEEPKTNDGYKVHIKGVVDYQGIIKEVAQRRKLAVSEENGELIVFKP